MNAFEKTDFQAIEELINNRKFEIHDMLRSICNTSNQFFTMKNSQYGVSRITLGVSTNRAWWFTVSYSNGSSPSIVIPDEFVQSVVFDRDAFILHFKEHFAKQRAFDESRDFYKFAENFKTFPRHIAIEMIEMLQRNCSKERNELWDWRQMEIMRKSIEDKLTEYYGK